MNDVLFSSKSEEWATPQDVFDELDAEFHFTLDPCATADNAKCKKYYTKDDDGLLKDWHGETVFCNPPYGREIGKWIAKADKETRGGATVVLLLPARTDTRYFHDYIYQKHETRFLRGRVHFNNAGRAPFPSMVVIMKKEDYKMKQTTFVCDRCGNEIEKTMIERTEISLHSFSSIFDTSFDICPSCKRDFFKFMSELKESR